MKREMSPCGLSMNKIEHFVISALTNGKYSSLQDESNIDDMLRLIVLNIIYTVAL